MSEPATHQEGIVGRRVGVSLMFSDLSPPYATIVADPPWTYKTTIDLPTPWTNAPSHSAAAAQYPTLTISDLCQMPVEELASANSHLYLWTTNPMLPHSFAVMESWGFRYITTITWQKIGPLGMGFYWRGDTEHVLFGVKGKLPIAPADRQRNIFQARKQGHSIKPDVFLDLVEKCSPGPYVELFARRRRMGWDSWGNDV